MREIKELAAFIQDEVNGALSYAKCAVYYKNTRPDLASLLYNLATTEAQHAQKLHAEVAKLITEAEKHTNYPQEMRDKWEKIHKASMKKLAKANSYIAMYKG